MHRPACLLLAKTTTLTLAADTDAVAVFFPPYADVTEIRYAIGE